MQDIDTQPEAIRDWWIIEHMRLGHEPFDDAGREVPVPDFARIVHCEDHDASEALLHPHDHSQR